MAALDDLVGALVFFLIVALVSANLSAEGIPVAVVLLLVLLPIFIGIVTRLCRPASSCSAPRRRAARWP